MSYSRRQLYALGEPLGEFVTIPKLGGGYICGGGGDGGGKGGGDKGGVLGAVGAVASIGLAIATDGASLAAEGAIDGAIAATDTAIASETFASAADVVAASADAAISAGADAAAGTAAADSIVTTGADAAASSIIPTDIPSVVTPPPEVAPYLDTTPTIPDVVPQTPSGGLPAADVVPTPDVAPLTPPAPAPDVAPPTGGLPSVDAATAQSVADAEDAAIGQSFQNAGFNTPQPGVLQSLADAGVPVPVLQNLPTIQSMTQLAAANAASQLLSTGKVDIGSLTTSILAGSAGNLVGGLAAGQVYSDTQSALAASIASSVAKGATTAFISGQDPVQSGIASGIAGGIGSFTDGAVPQPFINAVVNSTFTKTPLDQALVGAAAQIGVGAAKDAVFGTQAPAPVETGVPSIPDQSAVEVSAAPQAEQPVGVALEPIDQSTVAQPSGALPSETQPSTTDQSAGALPATKLPEVTVTESPELPESPVVTDSTPVPAPAPAPAPSSPLVTAVVPVSSSGSTPVTSGSNLVDSGLSLLSSGQQAGALPKELTATYLPAAPLQSNDLKIAQLKQLYPQLVNVDPKLLSILSARNSSAINQPPYSGSTDLSGSALSTPSAGYPSRAAGVGSEGVTSFMNTSDLMAGGYNALTSAGLRSLGVQSPYGLKKGGSVKPHIPEFITGKTGHYVEGRGDGQSDEIPAMLADGEYVFDAESVAQLGNGSSKAGAKLLDHFRESLREHKRSAPTDKIPPASSPLAYMREALKRNKG